MTPLAGIRPSLRGEESLDRHRQGSSSWTQIATGARGSPITSPPGYVTKVVDAWIRGFCILCTVLCEIRFVLSLENRLYLPYPLLLCFYLPSIYPYFVLFIWSSPQVGGSGVDTAICVSSCHHDPHTPALARPPTPTICKVVSTVICFMDIFFYVVGPAVCVFMILFFEFHFHV